MQSTVPRLHNLQQGRCQVLACPAFPINHKPMPTCTVYTLQICKPRPGRWDTGWRTLPMALIETPHDGEWTVELDGLPNLSVTPKDALVIPAGWRHRLRNSGKNTSMTSTWCYLRWCDDRGSVISIPDHPTILQDEALSLIDDLAPGPTLRDIARTQRAAWRLAELLSDHQLRSLPHESGMRKLNGWIQAHLHENLTRVDLAEAMDCSKNTLHRLCITEMGISPMRLLAQMRIERAQELLVSTNLPLFDIAQRCGFGSQFYFSRAFRQACNTTPSAFRLQRKSTHPQ